MYQSDDRLQNQEHRHAISIEQVLQGEVQAEAEVPANEFSRVVAIEMTNPGEREVAAPKVEEVETAMAVKVAVVEGKIDQDLGV